MLAMLYNNGLCLAEQRFCLFYFIQPMFSVYLFLFLLKQDKIISQHKLLLIPTLTLSKQLTNISTNTTGKTPY